MNDAHQTPESNGAATDPHANASENPKLAGAKDAVKKKLLRLVARQAMEELSDSDAVAQHVVDSGLIKDEALESIKAQMIGPLLGKIMPEGGIDPDQVLDLLETDPGYSAAVANVNDRLLGAVSRRVLEGFTDEGAMTKRLVDQLVESNKDAVEELAANVQDGVMAAVAQRAWQRAVESDDLALHIENVLDRNAQSFTDALSTVRDRIAHSIADEAVSSIAESKEMEAIVSKASESARETVLASILREVAGADDEELADAAVQRIGSDHQAVVTATRATKTRLLAAIRDRAVDAIADSEQTARSAWTHISGDEPSIVAAVDQLRILLYQDLGNKVLREITDASALEETAATVVSREANAVETAVDSVFERVAREISNRARTRLSDSDAAAAAATDYIEHEDERIVKATGALEDQLLNFIANRAVDRIKEPSGLERIKQVTAKKEAALIESTTASLRDSVIDDIVQRAGYALSDAGDTARRARERMGSENAAIVASTEVLKELVLEDLAKNATFDLLEPAKAAERAFARVDTGDPRFIRSSDAVRERLISAIADHSLTALASSDEAAQNAYGRIDKANELIVGATAVLRDRLIADIAGRAERTLEDSRAIAEQARDRVPNESPVIQKATHSLRDLLLEDMVAMTRTALEDAEQAANDAMAHVDSEDEVISRARSLFKERVLVTILGEAIREISVDVSGNTGNSGQGAFHQAFQALSQSISREGIIPSGDGGSEPRKGRRPSAPISVNAAPRHDRSAAPPSGGQAAASISVASPSVDIMPTGSLAPTSAAELVVAPGEAWTRLSDMQPDSSRMERVAAPERLDDLIVTEYVADEASDHIGETDSTFDWSFDFDDSEDAVPASPAEAVISEVDSDPQMDVTWEADDGTVCYVYGFMPASESASRAPKDVPTIDSNHPIRLVSVRGVRAIVSKVPSDQFDAEHLAKNSKNGSWLKSSIRAHADTLGAFKNVETVAPMRFGAVYRNEAEVAEMLDQQHDSLSEMLERLKGRREWAVRVMRDNERLRSRIAESRREVEDSLDSISTGVAQFVKDELEKSGELDDQVLGETVTQNCLKRVHAFLTKWSDGGMQKPLVSRQGVDLVMNAAYLVESGAAKEFAMQVSQLEKEFESLGFSFDTSGPWPPFHFVESNEQQSAAIAAALV